MEQKLKRTLERILNLPEFSVRMATFASVNTGAWEDSLESEEDDGLAHECGTTFCIAGRLAFEDGYPEQHAHHNSCDQLNIKGMSRSDVTDFLAGKKALNADDSWTVDRFVCNYNYDEYTEHDLGLVNVRNVVWDWLFNSAWSDDLIAAKARAWAVLYDGKVPTEFLETIMEVQEVPYEGPYVKFFEACATLKGQLDTVEFPYFWVESAITVTEKSQWYNEMVEKYREQSGDYNG